MGSSANNSVSTQRSARTMDAKQSQMLSQIATTPKARAKVGLAPLGQSATPASPSQLEREDLDARHRSSWLGLASSAGKSFLGAP